MSHSITLTDVAAEHLTNTLEREQNALEMILGLSEGSVAAFRRFKEPVTQDEQETIDELVEGLNETKRLMVINEEILKQLKGEN